MEIIRNIFVVTSMVIILTVGFVTPANARTISIAETASSAANGDDPASIESAKEKSEGAACFRAKVAVRNEEAELPRGFYRISLSERPSSSYERPPGVYNTTCRVTAV